MHAPLSAFRSLTCTFFALSSRDDSSFTWTTASVMITFKPLSEPYYSPQESGSSSVVTEKPKALAYLAEVDDVRILVDCGSPEDFRFDDNGGGLDDILRE